MSENATKTSVTVDPPRKYDLDNPAERLRLYREVRGYLHTCHHQHGTDWKGRKFAMDALDELQREAQP